MTEIHLRIGPGCPSCTWRDNELSVDLEAVIRAAGFEPSPDLLHMARDAMVQELRRDFPQAILVEELVNKWPPAKT